MLLLGPAAAAADPFTVVVLPDTQYYTQTESNNTLYFKGQTGWIAANKQARNIAFVLHLGDIQNDGNPYYARTDDIYQPDFSRPTGLVPDDAQFRRADAALDILDAAGVPYSLLPGNHDFIDNTIKDEPIYYLQWFGPQRYAGMPTFGGGSPATPTSKWAGLNTWHTFEAGGYRFLNIALQFAADTNDLAWAQSVINAHPGVPTILTTHALLNTTGFQSGYQHINDLFVQNNPQVVMTLNGHVNGTFRQTVANIAGQPVQQMLVDYQSTILPGAPFKGGGYLRTMEFDVDAKVVSVESYSPVANAALTDAANRFTLPLDLPARFAGLDEPGIRHTVTFQQGVGGYGGTRDTYVSAAEPTANNAALAGLWVDGDASDAAGAQARQALVRFDDIFGTGGIPAGAAIDAATLSLRTSRTANSQSNDPMAIHRVIADWSDTATWSGLGEGVAADGGEAILGGNATFVPAVNGGALSFDVTESLFAWRSGAPNRGWAFLPGGTDGWRFESAEASTVADRPALTVTYTVRPPSADILVNVAAGSRTQAEAGFPAIVGSASVTKAGPGTVVFDGLNGYTGPTVVAGGTLVIGRPDAVPSSQFAVQAGATLVVDAGLAVQVRGVTLAGGKVDVGQGRLAIAPGGTTEAALRAHLIAGRSGGSFSGTSGITTTGGAAGLSSQPVVGYRVFTTGSALVAWAAFGDSNLDGQVNLTDVILINNGGTFGQGPSIGATWVQGDYNYSGGVTLTDINLLNNSGLYGTGSYLPVAGAGSLPGGGGVPVVASVPEPGTWVLALAGLAGGWVLRRRRTRPVLS